MNTVRRLGIPLLVLALVAIYVARWRTLSALQRENRELIARVQAARSQAETDAQTPERMAQQAELEQLRSEAQDLPRLRNEVRQLRAATNELAKLRAELERLQASTNRTATAQSAQSGSGTLVAKENWVFAGYASPDDAFQSAIWAMNKGDLKTFMASLSPEGQEHVRKEWENKSDEEIERMNASELKKIEGYRIGERKIIDENTVVLNVSIEGRKSEKKHLFKKQGNEWKLAGPAED